MESDRKEKIHLLMRFSDKKLGVKSTINEHQKILLNFGAVWIGKFGKPLTAISIERINTQCNNGFTTYLYLVQRVGAEYEAFKCTIVNASKTLPIKEKKLVPEYYRNEQSINDIEFWVKLSEIKPIKSEELNNLHVSATKSAIPDILPKSAVALFIVSEGEGKRIE